MAKFYLIGAKLNIPDLNGQFAIHMASNFGLTDVIKELLSHGADVFQVFNFQ